MSERREWARALLARTHVPGCAFILAATGPAAVECEHGCDACPECTPCTCGPSAAELEAADGGPAGFILGLLGALPLALEERGRR